VITTYDEYRTVFDKAMKDTPREEVEALVEAIEEAYDRDKTVFFCGNGGSAANASHFCEDVGKGTIADMAGQKRLRVISLTDNTPYILAWANDNGYETIFVEQLKNLAGPGDLLVSISGSGNSPNVLRAMEYAKEIGMKNFGITGYDGGKVKKLADACLHVPCDDMGVCEAVHVVLFHYVVYSLYDRFAKKQG